VPTIQVRTTREDLSFQRTQTQSIRGKG
jgi:hypothetical protein